jgi:hypothetical protein
MKQPDAARLFQRQCVLGNAAFSGRSWLSLRLALRGLAAPTAKALISQDAQAVSVIIRKYISFI